MSPAMEYQIRYLKAKALYDHLDQISCCQGVLEEASLGLAFASSSILLEPSHTMEESDMKSLGGLSANDLIRYGPPRNNLSRQTKSALLEALKNTLNQITSFYYGNEDPNNYRLCHSLPDDVEKQVSIIESDSRNISLKIEKVVSLYQECAETHLKLNETIKAVLNVLPSVANANHSALQEFLAMTIETSLLKLSVVRARLKSSLYGHTVSSSNSRLSVADSINQMHDKLVTQQAALERQERDVQGRLMEYQRLIELVDGKDGSFSQVVEDLTIVQRETEECQKDLRRLGWTEE